MRNSPAMPECVAGTGNAVPLDPDGDCAAALTALRAAGAERFDPLRFHGLEALARRTARQPQGVRAILDARLTALLADFSARFAQARSSAQTTLAHLAERHPEAAAELQQCFAAGDFRGIQRFAAMRAPAAPGASLGDLVRQLAHAAQQVQAVQPVQAVQAAPARAVAGPAAKFGAPAELKAIRYYRNTWSKLSVDKQMIQALEQAPEQAGPLNSHFLVLQSLTAMRDLAPDYLHRFMSYVDTLLCLDQANIQSQPVAKKPQKPKASKRRAAGAS